MTDDIVVRLRRHARVPFEKIERKAAFDAAKRVVKQPNADIVDRLRAIVVVSGGVTNANVDHIVKAANEIERLQRDYSCICSEMRRMMDERDAARLQTRRILNEIDCRIEHGAESNGHLEAIRNLFTEATDDR